MPLLVEVIIGDAYGDLLLLSRLPLNMLVGISSCRSGLRIGMPTTRMSYRSPTAYGDAYVDGYRDLRLLIGMLKRISYCR